MTAKYIINKIIFKKENPINNFYLILLTKDNYKLFGFNNFIPMKDDIIVSDSKNIIIKDSNKELEFKNVQFLLPETEHEQKIRLLHILNGDANIIDNFNKICKIKYGNEFWVNFYKWCLELQEIDNYEIDNFISTVFNYIIKYVCSFLQPFKKILSDEYNIKNLNHKQLMTLYKHKNFGPNIKSWNITGLKLLYEISGFSEETILKIARGLKMSINEISQLIIIGIFIKNGSTYIKYNYNNWLDYLSEYYDDIKTLSNDTFNNIIEDLIDSKDIIVINEDLLCYYYLYEKELSIAKTLIKIQYNEEKMSFLDFLNLKETSIKITLNDIYINDNPLDEEQKNGIFGIFTNKISIIHGQAGTGKSTLLTGLLSCIEAFEYKTKTDISIYFLTPTASAVQRIKDILSEKWDNLKKYYFGTLHGFIAKLKNNIKNISDNSFNIFIIDESSMIDILLLNELLPLLINYNIIILFLGDIRQLPSIGSGNILHDIIKCTISNIESSFKIFNCTELINTYRYDDKKILKNIINKILSGYDINEIDYINNLNNEFKLIIPDHNIKEIIKNECKNNDTIITPLNQNISKYTNTIRDIINPDKKEFDYNNFIFRIGDPIIYTKNDYNECNLFNGLTGKVIDIFNYDDENIIHLKISRDDKKDDYTFISNQQYLKFLRPAYMISVHKSQGREYDNILILLTESRILNKNLLYTAITRAKKSVTLISSLKLLNKTIKKKEKRKTLLKYMIIYEYEKRFCKDIWTCGI